MLRTVVCMLLLLIFEGCVKDKEIEEWSLRPGDKLPDFCVTTIDGREITSADANGRDLVIVFFNTDCADCRQELPLIQQQYEVDRQLPEAERSRYICISREEGEESVRAYWQEHNLTLPVSAQSDRRVYSLFASILIPRIYVARDGKIISATP